jgi:hypothetical protein
MKGEGEYYSDSIAGFLNASHAETSPPKNAATPCRLQRIDHVLTRFSHQDSRGSIRGP